MESGHRRLYYFGRKKVSPSTLSQIKNKNCRMIPMHSARIRNKNCCYCFSFFFSVFDLTHNGRLEYFLLLLLLFNPLYLSTAGGLAWCAIVTLYIPRRCRSLYEQNLCFVIFQSTALFIKILCSIQS